MKWSIQILDSETNSWINRCNWYTPTKSKEEDGCPLDLIVNCFHIHIQMEAPDSGH